MICTEDELRTASSLAESPDLVKARLQIGDYAYKALMTELLLTPKPGLVDLRNSGAHRDMNVVTLFTSARVLRSWFPRFFDVGISAAHVPASDFLPVVRSIGVQCEREMFQATEGINTHKGAIFALGLLCSAAGRLLARNLTIDRECLCAEVARICADLVKRELGGEQPARTAGERIFRLYGLAGARGEAESGYSTVRSVALPIYDSLRRNGLSERIALLQSLLYLLSANSDTNLVSRGGLLGLNYVREYSQKLLKNGGVLRCDGLERLARFDHELIARDFSPGGSADLLAVTAFLTKFPTATPVNMGILKVDLESSD